MNDQQVSRRPNQRTPQDKVRWGRKKAEDKARYRHYLHTGPHVLHEQMMAWFDELMPISPREEGHKDFILISQRNSMNSEAILEEPLTRSPIARDSL